MLIVWSLPSLCYLGFSRWRHRPWREALRNIGWQGCSLEDLGWTAGVMLVLSVLGWLAFQIIPPHIFEEEGTNTSFYASWTPGVLTLLLAWGREALYIALGEEIFYRGWLGGWLMRRFGFWVGNTIQALVFLLPHLLLLTISLQLWPINLLQFVAGWLQGWLRYRSNSVLPSTLTHSLTNALGAWSAMG